VSAEPTGTSPTSTDRASSVEPQRAPAQRVLIVGASLAGLRTAEALRTAGWAGGITVVGEESSPPYDRPPLSKGVLTGAARATAPLLARAPRQGIDWLLGRRAVALDRQAKRVELDGGQSLGYDYLVIATGRRARPWLDESGAIETRDPMAGVVTIRSIDDALTLRGLLAASPRRVVIVGAGFIGCEVASAVRARGLPVTVVARGRTPLDSALGEHVGAFAAQLLEEGGVDFRPSTTVRRIRGGDDGRVRSVDLDDGSEIDADVVVVATGSLPNVEWLDGTGIGDASGIDPASIDPVGIDPVTIDSVGGVAVDGRLRALDLDGLPCPGIFAAGDVTRQPHPLAPGILLAVEHWGNAVEQGDYVARAIVAAAGSAAGDTPVFDAPVFDGLPKFWSTIFGTSVKSIGVPSMGDEVVAVQGSRSDHRGVLLYGRGGRTVAAVAIDSPRELDFYESLVAMQAPFPPDLVVADWGKDTPPRPEPARFPARTPALTPASPISTIP
jgi:3-phenylpropionate/trans-cinnamate dioxygenase ferredoxin reductase subunit